MTADTYVEQLQEKVYALVLEALEAGECYDTADDAIEDFRQSLINREWPEDVCTGCNRRVGDCICP